MTTAIGIDIGGTGIKGGRVDLATGELVSERIKYPTPEGGHPGDVLDVVEQILGDLTHGVTRSAANVSADWIDFPATSTFGESLGRDVHFVNDADAAGVAEAQYGTAAGVPGLVIVLTLGTGIGSAFLMDGQLVPNTELGHMELDGVDAEKRASNAAREREGLDFETWGRRVNRFLHHVEKLFSPDLFLIGGGVSKEHEEFFPFFDVSTEVKPAALLNNAGIVGAAYLAGNSLLD